jgi:hypothetical protein
VSLLRGFVSVGFVVFAFVLIGVWLGTESRLFAQHNPSTALAGAWTINEEASDHPDQSSIDRTSDNEGRGRQRGGGGFGRGGIGGRGGFGRGSGGGGAVDPEKMARMRDAMRDIMNPPAHLRIVQSGSLVIVTGPDGRTTRLAPDGKKIKDESTGVERHSKWEGEKLVSEISGAGPGKITETYWVDPEHHQLHRAVHVENTRRPLSASHVYDADAR